MIAGAWLSEPGHEKYLEIVDIIDNDIIDLDDLKMFAQEWLSKL